MKEKSEPAALPRSIDPQWVSQRLDALWPAHGLGMADLLIVLRRLFDGDLDAMLIVLVIAIGSRTEDWQHTLSVGDSEALQRPVNAASIAHITGIPRESVRRKLDVLTQRGLVQRCESGQWMLTPGISVRLTEGTEASIAYLVRLFNAALQQVP